VYEHFANMASVCRPMLVPRCVSGHNKSASKINHNYATKRARTKHRYDMEKNMNRSEMRHLSNLAKLHCDPSIPLSRQPECNRIIQKMMYNSHRDSELDMEFLSDELMYEIGEKERSDHPDY
jgi:hypothetical protein